VIRHGKVGYDRSYRQDYDSIYGADAKVASPLNAHDATGPYNYFNPGGTHSIAEAISIHCSR